MPDTLTVVVTASAKHAAGHRIDFKCRCTNRDGDVLVDAIASATAGNAFFVSELAKLAALGELDLSSPLRRLPLPQSVRDVLRWQLQRLSSSCQRTLALMSAAGAPLALGVLVLASQAQKAAVLDALSEGEKLGIVRVTVESDARFGFTHDLVREAIYRELAIAERARLHRRLAQALEVAMQHGAAIDASQLAHHYALGVADGDAERAVHYCALAGR